MRHRARRSTQRASDVREHRISANGSEIDHGVHRMHGVGIHGPGIIESFHSDSVRSVQSVVKGSDVHHGVHRMRGVRATNR